MLSRDKFTTVSVPSDGSCLYWATSLAYLFPVRHTVNSFTDRYVHAFGRDALSESSRLRALLLAWSPHGRPSAFTNLVTFMQPLVNGHFRQRIVHEMAARKDEYQHFISLNSFCESQNKGFFTRGLFQEHFQSEFGPEIEKSGVDIAILRPKTVGVTQLAEMDAELDKMASQDEMASFKYRMYLKCMALSTSWGGQHEIQAASQVLKCNIHVFSDQDKMADIVFTGGTHWIHLVHKSGNHYNFGLVKASEMLDDVKNEIRHDDIERCFSLGVDDVNVSNRFGWTMLHFSAFRGDERLARLLIENGAQVGAKNKHGKTPADLAQKYRMFGVLQMLEKEVLRMEKDNEIESRIQLLRNTKCQDNISQDIRVGRDKSAEAMQTSTLKSLVSVKDKKNMSSKETQTTGEQAQMRQVKVLQQQLLLVIGERNALEKTLLASKRLEQDHEKEGTTPYSGDDLMRYSDLKKRTSSSPTVRYKKHVPSHEHTCDVKFLALLFMRGLNHSDQFCMASNMDAAGCYPNVVFGYLLPQHGDWRTAFVTIVHKEKSELTRSDLINTSQETDFSLLKAFQAYSFMRTNTIDEGELKFCKQRGSFDYVLWTNARLESGLRIRQRDNMPRLLWLLNTGASGHAFSPDKLVDSDLYRGLNEIIRLKGGFNVVRDGYEEERTSESKRVITSSSKSNIDLQAINNKDLFNQMQNQVVKLVGDGAVPVTDYSLCKEFLGKFQIFSDQRNDSDLDSLIEEELRTCLEINDKRALEDISKNVQSEIEYWCEKGNYYLNGFSEFWQNIVTCRINHYSDNLRKTIRSYNVTWERHVLIKVQQVLPDNGLVNILATKTGSTELITCKVYESFIQFEDKVPIFVCVSDLTRHKNEILRAWQNVFCQTLVVQCEPDLNQDDVGQLCCELHSTIKNSIVPLRAVIISKTNLALAGNQQCREIDFEEYYDTSGWDDMTDATQSRLLSCLVVFQGNEMPLGSSVDTKTASVFMMRVHGDTLARLLKGEQIVVGSPLDNNIMYYVPRKLERHGSNINVTCVSDVPDRVVHITAEPGMGITTLFTHLGITTKLTRPSIWVAHVNLNDAKSFLNRLNVDCINENTAIEFVTKCSIKTTAMDLEKEMIRYCLECSGGIVVFIDRVEDVCTLNEEKVFRLLRNLLNTKMEQLWLTSRLSAKNKFENIVGTKSYVLKPFTKLDQRQFMKEYWRNVTTPVRDSRLNVLVSLVLELATQTFKQDQRMIGIPQHTRILADYFEASLKQFTNTDILSLPATLDLLSLYDSFVNTKFETYHIDRCNVDPAKSISKVDIETRKRVFVERFRHAALLLLLSYDEFASLDIDCGDVEYFLDVIRDGREKTGIIDAIVDGKPHFIHQTFAEYFAATWCADNFSGHRLLLQQRLLQPDFKVVRDIFDRCLVRDHEIHLAVLNRDINLVKELLSSGRVDVDAIDKGGRSALHLAVAYSGTEDISDYKSITDMLLNAGASVVLRDDVFEWKPLQYADFTNAWDVAGMIMQTSDEKWEMEKAKKNMASEVYAEFIGYLSSINYNHAGLLLASVQHEDSRVIDYLIKLRVDLNVTDNDGQTVLMIATRNGHLEVIKHLVNAGADVNIENQMGWNCLLIAFEYGFRHICEYLLGINVTLKRSLSRYELKQKNSVLLCASYLGDINIVKYQLQLKSDVHWENKTGWSSLLVATTQGHLEVMEYLISKGAKIMSNTPVDRQTIEQVNASFMCACFLGETDLIIRLLSHGVGVNAKGSTGWNSLLYAMYRNKINVVELLLTNQACLDLQDVSHFSQLQKDTALQCLAFQGILDGIHILVEKGANIDAINNEGWSSLLLASDQGHVEVMEYFSELSTTKQVFRSKPGTSLLQLNAYLLWTAFAGSLGNVKRLLKRGAHVNATNRSEWNALMLACQQGNLDCMEYLLSQGGHINPSGHFSLDQLNVALLFASFQGDLDSVKSLLKQGADVNAESKNGWNPFLFSAYAGNSEVMDFLVEEGAIIPSLHRLNSSSVAKNMSLICAAHKGDLHKLKYLVKQGANSAAENKAGCNAHMYATYKGNDKCVAYLLKHGNHIDTSNSKLLVSAQRSVDLLGGVFNGDLAKSLVTNGASVNFNIQAGTTPLHVSIAGNARQPAKYVLQTRESVNGCDNVGESPLLPRKAFDCDDDDVTNKPDRAKLLVRFEPNTNDNNIGDETTC